MCLIKRDIFQRGISPWKSHGTSHGTVQHLDWPVQACDWRRLHPQGPDGMQPWPEWVVDCMICRGKRSEGCMRVARYRALGDEAMVRVGQFKNPAPVRCFSPIFAKIGEVQRNLDSRFAAQFRPPTPILKNLKKQNYSKMLKMNI
jgi:hypothetical protein